jgi:hypothetical protein
MGVRTVDDKASDTLVVVSAEGFWTGSSTLPHLHHFPYPCAPHGARQTYGVGEAASSPAVSDARPMSTIPVIRA